MSKKLKWILASAGVLLLAGGGVLFASRGKDKGKEPEPPPFRVGKVQAEDLQERLFKEGLIGSETLKDFVTKRDLAAENVKAAQQRYEIVERHGIPISGDALTQRARVTSPMSGVVITKGVELGETVTSGVSSFNAGTVLFTVADLKTLLIRVNLNEVDIAKVKVGQPVRITLDAYT